MKIPSEVLVVWEKYVKTPNDFLVQDWTNGTLYAKSKDRWTVSPVDDFKTDLLVLNINGKDKDKDWWEKHLPSRLIGLLSDQHYSYSYHQYLIHWAPFKSLCFVNSLRIDQQLLPFVIIER